MYNLLRQVYMSALHDTYIFPIVTAGMALLMTFAVEHKNIKKIDKEREETRNQAGVPMDAGFLHGTEKK